MKRIALAFVALATMATYSSAHAFSINTGGGVGVRIGKTMFEHSSGANFSGKRAGFETKTMFTDGGKFGFGHSREIKLKR